MNQMTRGTPGQPGQMDAQDAQYAATPVQHPHQAGYAPPLHPQPVQRSPLMSEQALHGAAPVAGAPGAEPAAHPGQAPMSVAHGYDQTVAPQVQPAQPPQQQPQPQPQPQAAAPSVAAQPQEVPQDFLYDTEHPELPLPFKATIAGHKLDGVAVSVTAAYVSISGGFDPSWQGRKEVVKLEFQFRGFSVTLFPEMVVAGSRQQGEMTLQFKDPLGDHLPQLRYIMNSYISGDYVSMSGMLSYSGPTAPKAPKAETKGNSKRRIRSVAVAVISASLIVLAANVLLSRFTQSYEIRPVFIERAGSEMKATTAGQVSYLNPDAKQGEVVFSINANSGDVLNFQLPCDCEVTVAEGIFEGATVLPIDAILSFFDSTVEPRVKTQMSLEGLSKAMSGERVALEINDGRVVPVQVVVSAATNSASLRGDLFVPVTLQPEPGGLTTADIGKTARVRLTKSLFGFAVPNILDLL